MLTTDFINWIRQWGTILQGKRNNKKNMINIFLQIVFIRNYLFDYVSKIYIDQAKYNKRICSNYRNVINLTIAFFNNTHTLMYALLLFLAWRSYYSYSCRVIVLKTKNDKKKPRSTMRKKQLNGLSIISIKNKQARQLHLKEIIDKFA